MKDKTICSELTGQRANKCKYTVCAGESVLGALDFIETQLFAIETELLIAEL